MGTPRIERQHRCPIRIAAMSSLAIAIAFGVMPATAAAYTISNELSDGCHERITADALRKVRRDSPTASPLPISDNDRALVDDLQFTPDDDMRDLGGATLLIAVRDNDLKGRPSDDLSALAEVHGNPDGQNEHCLRGADDKEPGGSKAAVDACRAYIRERAQAALEGLDDRGMPDGNRRTPLTVHLSMRGTVHAPLPTYYVAAGQALHAIEDSFTHTYRTADQMKITVVLNWLAEVNATRVESRDGPAHAKALDRCDDLDELRTTRHRLAIEAAVAFLHATLGPQKTKDEKMAAVDKVLDTYQLRARLHLRQRLVQRAGESVQGSEGLRLQTGAHRRWFGHPARLRLAPHPRDHQACETAQTVGARPRGARCDGTAATQCG